MSNSSTAAHQSRISPLLVLFLIGLNVILFWLLVVAKSESASSANASAGPDQEALHWRLVTTWPPNFPGLGTAPVRFAERVNKMSNGRLQIDVYGAGQIVQALEVFDAVSNGAVEMGHGAAYYWKGKVPAAQFFTAVPFGFNAQETNGWLHHGGGMALWREIYQPFNLIPFAGGSTGVQMGGWFNREINSLDDIKGLKMRIPGLGGEVISRAGGTAVTIPGGELYTSMQTGVIDATEWVGPFNDLAFGFQEVAQYYYYPGWHEAGAMMEFIVNADAFASLPQDLQEIVASATREINQDMLDEYTSANNRALRELVEVHGVKLRRFPDEVLRTLKKISFDLYRETAANDPQFAKVYQAYMDYYQQVSAYHEISEDAYYQARKLEITD